MSAKTNIEKLPDWCFDINLRTGKVIKLKAGESGYWEADQEFPKEEAEEMDISLDEYVDYLNKVNLGVSHAERIAMSNGSMWGWDIPMADPDFVQAMFDNREKMKGGSDDN